MSRHEPPPPGGGGRGLFSLNLIDFAPNIQYSGILLFSQYSRDPAQGRFGIPARRKSSDIQYSAVV